MATPWKIRRTIDIEEWEQKAEYLGILAFTGAKKAHQLILTIFENDQPVTFASATSIRAYFMRSGEQVMINGSVTANVITVKFPAAAYAIQTRVSVIICAENTDEKVPLYAAVFDLGNGSENVIVDPDDIIPDVSAVLAQGEAAQEAAAAANRAADAANEAAGRAPYIDEATGIWFIWNNDKGTYTDTGIVAAGKKGEPGDDAPIPYIGANGNWFVAGADTGVKAQGPAGANGTGSGTVTGVRIGDTVYEPDDTGVVEIENVGGDSLPAGGSSGQVLAKKTDTDGDAEWVDPPEGTMKSVCGKEADESGNVDLDATDVGAVSIPNEDDPTYGVATGINADMLGGVPASNYVLKSEIPAAGTGLPAGGSAGQVLAKKSDADGDVEWKNETTGTSYDQSLNKTDDVTFNSVSTTQPINAGKLGGKEASEYVLATSFEEWTFTLDDGSTVTKKVIVVD